MEEIDTLKNLIKTEEFNSYPESMKLFVYNRIKEQNRTEIDSAIQSSLFPLLEKMGEDSDIVLHKSEDGKWCILRPVTQKQTVKIPTPSPKSHGKMKRPLGSKSASKKLKVTFPDGTVIMNKLSKVTWIETLRKIGLDKLGGHEHGITCAEFKLVDKSHREEPGNNHSYQAYYDGWWVYTLIDNDRKVMMLNHLSEFYGLNLKIELV